MLIAGLAMAACGTSGSERAVASGTTAGTTTSVTSAPPPCPTSTAAAISCPMGYCNSVGLGGQALAYSGDAQPLSSCASTATLHADALCIDGTVTPLLPMLMVSLYDTCWGCGIGVNLDQAPGATSPAMAYTLQGTGVTVTTSGVPCCTSARVILDEGGVDYCAALTDGMEIPWATFNTECWYPPSGVALAAPPTSHTVRVELVPSESACPFSNFCITSIHL